MCITVVGFEFIGKKVGEGGLRSCSENPYFPAGGGGSKEGPLFGSGRAAS